MRIDLHPGRRINYFVKKWVIMSAGPRAAIAAELGLTEGNLRVALHRLRARFAAGLRAEVAATLRDAADEAIEAELRALFAVLGG
jgi:DNA-binding transcriptional regulator PaaX